MRKTLRGWLLAPLLLASCAGPVEHPSVVAKQRYLAAKSACESRFPAAMVRQSDCRTDAANAYIRPFYRYGDLMTRLQTRRRGFAVRVDGGKMSRAAFHRLVAREERAVEREETQRNIEAGLEPAPDRR